jgi:hypothetical protein
MGQLKLKGNSRQESYFDFPQTVGLDTFTEYKVFFGSRMDQISLYVNGDHSWTCKDTDGFNADENGFFGFARSSEHPVEICDVDVKDDKEHQPHSHLAMTKTLV